MAKSTTDPEDLEKNSLKAQATKDTNPQLTKIKNEKQQTIKKEKIQNI